MYGLLLKLNPADTSLRPRRRRSIPSAEPSKCALSNCGSWAPVKPLAWLRYPRLVAFNAGADGKPDRSQQQQKQGRNHASFAKKDEQICNRKEQDERDTAGQRAGGLFKYGNQRAGENRAILHISMAGQQDTSQQSCRQRHIETRAAVDAPYRGDYRERENELHEL